MRWKALILAALLPLAACGKNPSQPATQGVTDAMLLNPPEGEWLSHGRDYGEQRFSPLTQITGKTVGQLGLAWSADLDTARGQEATPLMHGGVLYITTAWSMVKAYDARTGALKWSYDPKVPRETLARACCDAVNRGVALYGDKVYLGTLDGRLVALDQMSGKPVWTKVAVPNQQDYTITGAPRVAKGKVFIGSGGAEFKARGYIAAYDAENGEELWKFHTVPGDPAEGFENAAMEKAAKTWAGEWWKLGGGGTVWDGITYDPKTNLVLFGTGNAEPWNPAAASREGDSLYTSSLVAVNADTGDYAWHFQETPEDRWDYDSAAQITLADIAIGGQMRHVALHAPKNGFVYVIDAATGQFISAGAYGSVNWTTGIDPKSGKPTINPEARYEQTGKPFLAMPGALGGHSWQPMSFSSASGLVYIPVNFAAFPYAAAKDWKPAAIGYHYGLEPMLWTQPAPPEAAKAISGALVAWNPVTQKEAWRTSYADGSNGGVLATAGGLVFHGGTDGRFQAFSAAKGAPLWSFDAQSSIIAAPMTYAIGGEQYVAVLSGWGGGWGGMGMKSPATRGQSRLLVFKLGGKARLPQRPAQPPLPALAPPPFTGTVAQVTSGAALYGRFCFVCHGGGAVAGDLNPDLRRSAMLADANAFRAVVIDGALGHNGMVSFKPALKPDDAEAIRHYLIKRANDDKAPGLRSN